LLLIARRARRVSPGSNWACGQPPPPWINHSELLSGPRRTSLTSPPPHAPHPQAPTTSPRPPWEFPATTRRPNSWGGPPRRPAPRGAGGFELLELLLFAEAGVACCAGHTSGAVGSTSPRSPPPPRGVDPRRLTPCPPPPPPRGRHYIKHGILASDPFETLDTVGVGELVRIAAERGRATRPGIELGICGEHGGDPASVAFFHDAGLDYVSCRWGGTGCWGVGGFLYVCRVGGDCGRPPGAGAWRWGQA
jgi:hypothetical protein